MEMEMVRPDFEALKDLLDMANNLLHSPIIKETIFSPGQDKWVHEISEASLRILSSCGNIKDVLMLLKDHMHSLQSTFRRVSICNEREGHNSTTSTAGNKFSGYSLQRKELKKVMLQRLGSLKGMKNACITSDVSALNQNLIIVINVLRQVRTTTMSIIESLLSLMSIPSPNSKTKSTRGFFKAKLTRVDSLSSWENCSVGAGILQAAGEKLKAAEVAIRDLEEELESIFRRLIQTRVSLLNMLNNQTKGRLFSERAAIILLIECF